MRFFEDTTGTLWPVSQIECLPRRSTAGDLYPVRLLDGSTVNVTLAVVYEITDDGRDTPLIAAQPGDLLLHFDSSRGKDTLVAHRVLAYMYTPRFGALTPICSHLIDMTQVEWSDFALVAAGSADVVEMGSGRHYPDALTWLRDYVTDLDPAMALPALYARLV